MLINLLLHCKYSQWINKESRCLLSL